MTRLARSGGLALALAMSASACGPARVVLLSPDGGVDGGLDAGRDTGIDTGTDVGVDVGIDAEMVYLRCPEALERRIDGARCAFSDGDSCRQQRDACCIETMSCIDGVTRFTESCDSCRCSNDRDCTRGTICTNEICSVCPDVSRCRESCPQPFALLTRNGCPTCTCAPTSPCDADHPCDQGECVRGSVCADDCIDPEECCVRACVYGGCGPPPSGCATECSQALRDAGCVACSAADCRCDGQGWTCTPYCVPPTSSCNL